MNEKEFHCFMHDQEIEILKYIKNKKDKQKFLNVWIKKYAKKFRNKWTKKHKTID